jgi:(p)ppGpp synthase/HD superfamily hydrolase
MGFGFGFEQDLYKRALDFAAGAHGAQRVPGSGHPYVVHLAKVAMEVLAATEGAPAADRDLALACALLHDTVEDADPADRARLRRELASGFGQAVADGVAALTKDDDLPSEDRMEDSLRRLLVQPAPVRMVKLADRITNLEPPPPGWTPEKRRGYRAEARRILEALQGSNPALEERLRRKIEEYERHCR